MKSSTIPLAVPADLYEELKTAATDSHLSTADVMRQTMKLGLPKFREQHQALAAVKPFTKAEVREAFAPDPEWDRLESALARRPRRKPEAD